MQWLGRAVADLWRRGPGSIPGVRVGFSSKKWQWDRFFWRVLRFSYICVIPSLRIHFPLTIFLVLRTSSRSFRISWSFWQKTASSMFWMLFFKNSGSLLTLPSFILQHFPPTNLLPEVRADTLCEPWRSVSFFSCNFNVSPQPSNPLLNQLSVEPCALYAT